MNAGLRDQSKIVGEDVWLTVPPFSEYLRTARLVAADAARPGGPRLRRDRGLPHRGRRAVSSADVVDRPRDRPCRSGSCGRCVLAHGRAQRRPGAPLAPLNDLSRAIIDSVTDHHELTDRDDELGFAVMKEARGSAQR